VDPLRTALKNDDDAALIALFGQAYADKLLMKDRVAAREGRERVYQAMTQGVELRQDTADRVVLLFGSERWPFPMPLVKSGSEWRFQTAAGLDAILTQRIGLDELNAIRVCWEYIQAQREYASERRGGSPVRQFAQRLVSTKGKQDGLYWDPATAQGEESPFGPLIAEYLRGGRKPGEPYYGYYFRVLTRQGAQAPGGRYNYVINGHMFAGFALVAFPAEYGESGIMTFLVSHHGTILQKDLGPRSLAIARDIQEFNPDKTWAVVQE
jgi:hypothetical protein